MSRYGYSDRRRSGGGGGGGGFNHRGRGYQNDRQMSCHGGHGGGATGGGAEHLARIHGTEEDRVNCPFYYKIGACRHGDRCSRMHNKPLFSQTLLIHHIYQNPLAKVIAENGNPNLMDHKRLNEEFEDFFEELYEELCTYGKVEQMNIMDNLGEHLLGNIYVKFEDEEDAAAAHKALYGRFYAGAPIICEYSPVTDFRESRCRQFDDGTCTRGGYCNFMHIRSIPNDLMDEFDALYNTGGQIKKKENKDDNHASSDDDDEEDDEDDDNQSEKSNNSPRSRSRSPPAPKRSGGHKGSSSSSRRSRSRSPRRSRSRSN